MSVEIGSIVYLSKLGEYNLTYMTDHRVVENVRGVVKGIVSYEKSSNDSIRVKFDNYDKIIELFSNEYYIMKD